MSRLENNITRLIRPEIQALSAYAIPNPGELVKLDAMENPYAWPEELINEWLDILRNVSVNRYPDPNANALKSRLRSSMDIPQGMELMLGNGSDEIIQIIMMALNPGQVVLSPAPSFVMYNMIATFTGLKYVGVPITNDFELDMDAMTRAIQEHHPAVIFIAYPNNPTGNLFKRKDILKILNISDGLVVIDEAYHAFADDTFMAELNQFENLLIMRTVSKMGLAGLRLGFLAGHEKWLYELNKIRLPYNINILTQISAEFALNHHALFSEQTSRICHDRENLLDELNRLQGLTVFPSNANFILLRTPAGESTRIFESLKSKGILIKNMGVTEGLLRDCLRVTVGTPEENRRFLTALSAII